MSRKWVVWAYVRGGQEKVPNIEPRYFFTRWGANHYMNSMRPALYLCYLGLEKR